MLFRDFRRCDVIFLHAPSIYDFRKDNILFGPISDVIPSTSVFEMYPVGMTSIANTLEEAGYNVRIINIAYRMLRNPKFDVEKYIKKLNPRLWAIDLHWMPHVHGVMAIAEIIKKYHPYTPILLGGLSSSYFHKQLVLSPTIDFVIRGDSTELPVLKLVEHLRTGKSLYEVPNLTWKKDGQVIINPLSYVPASLDEFDVPAYSYMMRSVFKYRNLANTIPYLRWLEYPMTMLLTARGCTQNCSICGGSRTAYKKICNRNKPAFRSPEKLIEDIKFITRFSKAPIFVVHDLRMAGIKNAYKFLELIKPLKIKNEIILELFSPAGEEYFKAIHEAIPNYSLEFTLETHDENLRKLNGKFPVSNEVVEETISAALKHGCHRLDIYFMTGIPKQSKKSAHESMDFARYILEKYGMDGRIKIYVAPLAPFLDPGSLAFENPQKYGYQLRARTLEEHRERLNRSTWAQILNYDSLTLPSRELAETTYDVTARLARIKEELGLISSEEAKHINDLTTIARKLMAEMEEAESLPEPMRTEKMLSLQAAAMEVNKKRAYQQTDFISWGGKRFQLRFGGLIILMIELWFKNTALTVKRLKKGNYRWTTCLYDDNSNDYKNLKEDNQMLLNSSK